MAAWNMMGGDIKWEALDYMVEHFGVEDVELFVTQLTAIREHLDTFEKMKHGR